MSIAHNILSQVEELVIKHKASKALLVSIRIGVLSGIIAEQLQFAFDIYKKEFSACENLELKIKRDPLVVLCGNCQKESICQDTAYTMECSHCSSNQTQVIKGKDMILEQVELDLE